MTTELDFETVTQRATSIRSICTWSQRNRIIDSSGLTERRRMTGCELTDDVVIRRDQDARILLPLIEDYLKRSY
jgi:hypothetical protein